MAEIFGITDTFQLKPLPKNEEGTKIGVMVYGGNGNSTREIRMGEVPKFAFVFAAEKSFVEIAASSESPGPPERPTRAADGLNTVIYAAAFGANNGSNGITATSEGIRVENSENSSGEKIRLNERGVKYVLVAFI